MTEYALNQLTSKQLAEFAYQSATRIAEYSKPSVRLELFYIKGHFIEITFSLKKSIDAQPSWHLYSVNHYPDSPKSTKYLTIYLQQISLCIN